MVAAVQIAQHATPASPRGTIDIENQILRLERRACYRAGFMAELASAALLMVKGYRILSWRHRTRAGEIDLIAAKGRVMAFVEVKYRPDLDRAHAALTTRQAHRLRRAAGLWLAKRTRFHNADIRFDAVLVVPGRLPVHVIDGA